MGSLPFLYDLDDKGRDVSIVVGPVFNRYGPTVTQWAKRVAT